MNIRRLLGLAWFFAAILQSTVVSAETIVTDVTFDWTTHQRLAPGSDNWPVTWADDDHQYTAWGDGGGFGGTNTLGRVSLGVGRVEGGPDNYQTFNVLGGQNPENPAAFPGKSYGILSIDGTLYMWVFVLQGHHFKESRLYRSTNYGASWTPANWKFSDNNYAFSVITLLNFGKDYAGARDDYVYLYTPGEKTINDGDDRFNMTDEVYLARVPKTQMMTQNAYEFLSGYAGNGDPTWSSNIADRSPVLTDTGDIHWTVQVAYSPGLNKYFLFNNKNVVYNRNTQLDIYQADEPWGPWTLAKSFSNWGPPSSPGYNFTFFLAPKWISPDGRDFTMVFSGTDQNDSWNTVKGSFLTDVSDSTPPTVPESLTAIEVVETQIDLVWQASTDQQSGIASYVVFRDGALVDTVADTAFQDQGLSPSTTYTYEVSAINGAGLESAKSTGLVVTTASDIQPPTIDMVTASVATEVSILFSEPVNVASAQNTDNYTIDGDIDVLAAQLEADSRTVTLQTGALTADVTYTLSVTSVTDRATPPNAVAIDTQVTFSFSPGLIGPVTAPGNYYWDILSVGATVYVDRTFTYTDVGGFANLDYLQTANDDKSASDNPFITFTVTQTATVFVAYDTRNSLPVWLQSWADTGNEITTNDSTFRLYSREYDAGPVTLGGNEMGGSMYVVIAQPSTGDTNEPPMISGAPATTVVVDTPYSFVPTASDPDDDTLSFSITNLPDWANFDSTSGSLSGTPGQGDFGVTNSIQISVSDGSASASLPAFDLQVTATNQPPSISGTPAGTVVAGTSYQFTPVATDTDGDALSFSVSNRPGWAVFDATSGSLSGTPGPGDIGIASNIQIFVSDGSASASLPAFDLQVTATNQPPSISGTPAGTVVAGTSYQFTPVATDTDGDALSFSVSNRPGWAVFDATSGSLSGTPGPGDIGIASNIQIFVSDGSASASLPAFDLQVTATNQPPSISGTPAGTVVAGTSYQFTPVATDTDGDALSFSVSNRPGWAVFDATSGSLSGTPGPGDIGIASNIQIFVSDGSASASLPAFDLQVTATNQPPAMSGTSSDMVAAGTTYEFTPTAIDPDGDVLIFFVENLPSWATFDPTSGTISGKPGIGDVGMATGIQISVSDGLANVSLPPFDIEVTGTPGENPSGSDAGGSGSIGLFEMLLIALALLRGRAGLLVGGINRRTRRLS